MNLHWIERDGGEGHEGNTQAVFPLWSFSKTAIAVLALQLEAEDALDLHAPFIPEGGPSAPVSLAQLLSHRAGIAEYGTLSSYHGAVAKREPAWPRARLLSVARAETAIFPAGTDWRYSNIGFMFARERIEAAAGASFADLVQSRIAAPLGLSSLRVAERVEDMACLGIAGLEDYDPGWVYHGCLTSTARDAARLLYALATGGLLPPPALKRLKEAHPIKATLPGRPWQTAGYGLGTMLGKMRRAGSVFGHSGLGPIVATAVYHAEESGRTIAAFARADNEGPVEDAVDHCACA